MFSLLTLTVASFTCFASAEPDISMCRNCPFAFREKTPEMIATEERIRLDLFHEKLLEAFRSLQQTGVPMGDLSGAESAELPSTISEKLEMFTARHFDDGSARDVASVDKMYILADTFTEASARRRRDALSARLCSPGSFACINATLPKPVKESRINSSILWIYPVPYPRGGVTLNVEDVSHRGGARYAFEVTAAQAEGSRGWIQLNVTPLMQRWALNGQNGSRQGILRLSTSQGQLRLADSISKRPYFEVKIQPTLSRMKRGPVRTCTSTDCCRKPLFFNWTQYNWSYIRQPNDGVDIGHCVGECKVITKKRHMIMNNEFQKVDAVVYPCCTPTQFADVDIIYNLNNTVYKGRFSNIIVDSCGCEI